MVQFAVAEPKLHTFLVAPTKFSQTTIDSEVAVTHLEVEARDTGERREGYL